MLKASIDPYSNLYKKLKCCLTDQDTISMCQKMVSYDALSIAEKLYYDLTNFYVIEFKKDSEARDVFKILITSPECLLTEEEKTFLLTNLYVKVRSIEYYKKRYWG